jgi:hypothetical protein
MDKAEHEILFRFQHQLLSGSLSIYDLRSAKGAFKAGYSLLFWPPHGFKKL